MAREIVMVPTGSGVYVPAGPLGNTGGEAPEWLVLLGIGALIVLGAAFFPRLPQPLPSGSSQQSQGSAPSGQGSPQVRTASGTSSAPESTQIPVTPCTRQLLREGNTGHCVRVLQQDLNQIAAGVVDVNGNPILTPVSNHGVLGHLTVDGIFGQLTKQAVQQLQAAMHLSTDGVVGPETWTAIQGLLQGIAQGRNPSPSGWSQMATQIGADPVLGTVFHAVGQGLQWIGQHLLHGPTFPQGFV